MNFKVFMEVAKVDVIPNSIIQIFSTTDNIGAVLRSHLICEQLAEAWVCGVCNNEHVFGSEDDRVKVECNAKLKIAKNLGMPISLYNAMKQLNKIRNMFAHTHQSDIEERSIISIADNVRNMTVDKTLCDMDNPTIHIYNEDTSISKTYTFNDPSTPQNLKLGLLIAEIIRHTVQNARKINTTRDVGDFSMR